MRDLSIKNLTHAAGIISGILNGKLFSVTLGALSVNTLYMIYYTSAGLVVSTNVNSVGPAGFTGWKLVGAFYSNGSFVFGSFVNISGPPQSGPQSNTPVLVGFGTPTNNLSLWSRNGDKYFASGSFTSGISTGVAAKISLGNLSLDTDKIVNNAIYRSVWGRMHRAQIGNTLSIPGTSAGPFVIIDDSFSDVAFLYAAISSNTTAKSFPVVTGNGICNNGEYVTYDFQVPILGWSNTQLLDL